MHPGLILKNATETATGVIGSDQQGAWKEDRSEAIYCTTQSEGQPFRGPVTQRANHHLTKTLSESPRFTRELASLSHIRTPQN